MRLIRLSGRLWHSAAGRSMAPQVLARATPARVKLCHGGLIVVCPLFHQVRRSTTWRPSLGSANNGPRSQHRGSTKGLDSDPPLVSWDEGSYCICSTWPMPGVISIGGVFFALTSWTTPAGTARVLPVRIEVTLTLP